MNAPKNPYPGPRSFKPGERLYGRERQVADLLDLLIAERIVLLYSPSGAGKTSLVQAALMPAMEQEGYRIRPVMRVSLEPPHVDFDLGKSNRYVLSCLISLEEALPAEERRSLKELAETTLGDYLGAKPSDELIVFDQFEEILTIDPLNRAAKEEFFAQLGVALRPRGRWALFSMREDYVGALDPYLRPVPTRLANTYRLDLLDVEGALLAIQQPALAAGAPLTDEAARKLVDDLRSAQVQLPDGTIVQQPGQHLEPVQLQVVCRRMWDRLPEGTTLITAEQVGAGGDINSALAGYYADSAQRIAGETGISERAIRQWFEHELITPQGIRGQVLQGADQSHGLDNRAVWPLVGTHLVRAEKRLGANWFELAHDRLISPVRTDNAAWFEANLSVLQRQAALWEEQHHPEGLLLRGAPLQDAERWANAHPELTPTETEFLGACRKLRAALVRQRVSQRLIQLLAVAACIGTLVAGYFWLDARRLARLAIAGVAAGEAQKLKDEHFDQAILLNLAALEIAERSAQGSHSRAAKLAGESAANLRNDIRILLRKDDFQPWWVRPTAFLWGFRQEVTALGYRPDGKVLAAGSRNGEIMFWDPVARKRICATTLRLDGTAAAFAFSDDGNSLAAASADGSVSLIDVSGLGRAVCPEKSVGLKPRRAVSRIEGLVFVQGRIVAHGYRELVVWRRDRPEQPEAVIPATEGARFQVFQGSDPGTIEVYTRKGGFRYDATTHNLVRPPGRENKDDQSGMAVAFMPTGDPIVGGSSPPSLLVLSAKQSKMCSMDWTGRVVVAPDGSRIASETRDLKVAVCDLRQCDRESTLSGAAVCPVEIFSGDNDSQVLAFHPKSVEMASGGVDGAIVLWNPERNSALMANVDEMAVLKRIAFLPNNRDMLRLGANRDLSIQFGMRTQPVPISDKAMLFATTEDGTGVAFVEQEAHGGAELVRIWKIGDGVVSDSGRSWKPDGPIAQLYAGSDRVVAVLEPHSARQGNETRIVTWEPSAGSAVPAVSKGPAIPFHALLEVSPHGGWLAASEKGITLFDLRAGTSRKLDVSAPVIALAFGGERFLAVKTAAPAIELWGVDGRRVATHEGEFSQMVVGADGLLAAVSSETSEISVWKTTDAKPRLLKYHDQPVNHLILASAGVEANSRFLLSADAAWTALWELATDEPRPLPIRIREKSSPVLSPGGEYVAGEFRSETEGMVLLYETNDNSWKKNACDIAGRTLSQEEWNDNFEGIPYDRANLPCPGMQPPPDLTALVSRWTQTHSQGRLMLLKAAAGAPSAENVRLLREAAKAYEEAVQLRSERLIPAAEWYQLCRTGTFLGQPRVVLSDCDRAVEQAPENPQFLDTRGMARAMTGDLAGASSDFRMALPNLFDADTARLRRTWIDQLGHGQNPVTANDSSRLGPSK